MAISPIANTDQGQNESQVAAYNLSVRMAQDGYQPDWIVTVGNDREFNEWLDHYTGADQGYLELEHTDSMVNSSEKVVEEEIGDLEGEIMLVDRDGNSEDLEAALRLLESEWSQLPDDSYTGIKTAAPETGSSLEPDYVVSH